MSEVTGVVEWAGKDKYGNHSIRIGDNWYKSKFEIKCNKGDEVSFDSGATGKYVNKLKVVKAGGGDTSSTSASPSTGGGKRLGSFPIAPLDGQRSIIRQSAVNRAVELVALDPKGLKNRDEMVDEVIRIASKLEWFCAGDMDREAAEAAKKEMGG